MDLKAFIAWKRIGDSVRGRGVLEDSEKSAVGGDKHATT